MVGVAVVVVVAIVMLMNQIEAELSVDRTVLARAEPAFQQLDTKHWNMKAKKKEQTYIHHSHIDIANGNEFNSKSIKMPEIVHTHKNHRSNKNKTKLMHEFEEEKEEKK